MARIGDRKGTSTKRSLVLRPVFCFFTLVVVAASLACTAMVFFVSSNHNNNLNVDDHHAALTKELQQPLVSNTKRKKPTATKTKRPSKPKAVVAYAISLIKCGDFQSSTAGLKDAAIVLKHSIHQTSIRNFQESNSHYDYKAYAIVHKQAEHCAQELRDAGFELLIRDPPVLKKDIQGEFLRKHIHREWCCGADEFVKLYAFTLFDHPIVVHVDVDFVFHKPMDDLFNAMLEDNDDKNARQSIPLERPKTDQWPKEVTTFMTRDWGQVMPGRRALFQAGFLVTRPSEEIFDKMVQVVKEGNYVEGFSRENGWGGKGYGSLVGAMAAQGLIAYVYDQFFPDKWVELNQCRFNHMGMDVLFRSPPSFRPNHPKVGKCRNDLDYCEDCMITPVEQIYNIHYTQCRKPWNCIGVGSTDPAATKESIPEDSVHLDHCMELLTIWHNYRTDLENKLRTLTGDESIDKGRVGDYKKQVFQGHCTGNGQQGYLELSFKPETLKRIPELYAEQ